jgi:hypothetical protein
MLRSDEPVSRIARTVDCSRKAVYRIRSHLERFGDAKAPPNPPRQQQIITLTMLKALCDHLLEHPTLYLNEMAVFLSKKFDEDMAICTISRALASIGWSKKVVQQKAKERNRALQDEYIHYVSDFSTEQLVFVDESGCDKRVGLRRTG